MLENKLLIQTKTKRDWIASEREYSYSHINILTFFSICVLFVLIMLNEHHSSGNRVFAEVCSSTGCTSVPVFGKRAVSHDVFWIWFISVNDSVDESVAWPLHPIHIKKIRHKRVNHLRNMNQYESLLSTTCLNMHKEHHKHELNAENSDLGALIYKYV